MTGGLAAHQLDPQERADVLTALAADPTLGPAKVTRTADGATAVTNLRIPPQGLTATAGGVEVTLPWGLRRVLIPSEPTGAAP